jgi:hypothetical protein
MYKINEEDLSIYVTRGDVVLMDVAASFNGKPYTFMPGDIVRIKVYKKKKVTDVVLVKDFPVTTATQKVQIYLSGNETKFDEPINKPTTYWYEVVLNEETEPQTIIGYDPEEGAKLFILLPEGATEGDAEDYDPSEDERYMDYAALVRQMAQLEYSQEQTHKAVAELYVTPEMYGAIGDGVADDTEAIQKAINSLEEGGTLNFHAGEKCYKLNSFIKVTGKKRIKIVNGKFDNSDNTNGCVFVVNNSDDVTFEDCTFIKGQQIILLYTCSNVFVNRCTFIETGYGIIQQDGYVSNNVNITNNRAFNLTNDFIECNCEVNAPSENWIITGNVYKRDLTNLEPSAVECRFFGATDCSNVLISNNVIEGARGDGAIHFEDCGNNAIIANNIIKNCNGYGYIVIFTSRRVLIENNIFENDTDLNVPFVFATYSDLETSRADETKIVISGNTFNGNKTQSDPLHLYALADTIIVDNNVFNDINVMFDNKQMKKMVFRNNIVHCAKFLNYDDGANSAKAFIYDSAFSNNKIYGGVVITNNINGNTCKRMSFSNNEFLDNVSISNAEDCIFHDNFLAEGKKLTFNATAYYSKRMYAYNNFVVNSGKIADVMSGT